MNPKEQLDALLDATAFDSTGAKVGAVRQIYVDDASGKLTFATVSTGIFSADAIVPLHGARLLDDELHVDHTRAVIRDSPRPGNTEDALTPDQEITLLEHYSLEGPERGRGAAEPKPKAETKPAPVPAGTKGASTNAGSAKDVSTKDDSAKDVAGKSKAENNVAAKSGAAKPDVAQDPPVNPDASKSAPSPVKDEFKGRSGPSAGSDSKSGGPAGGQKSTVAAPGEKTDGKTDTKADAETDAGTDGKSERSGGKVTESKTTTSSPSPTTTPAAPDRTSAARPGSTRPDTATTSEDSGKNASSERD